MFELRQNDFAALSAPPQLLKRRVDPAWDEGLKWFKCTMGGGIFTEEVASAHLIWLTDGWLRLTGASLEIDKGWLKECMSFAEFCHFQLITLLKQETRLDLLGRGWFAHQFQSNLARVHASKRSSNTAAPLFAHVSSLHTLRPSSILSKVRLRASNKTSHETRERSELGVGSQTLLQRKTLREFRQNCRISSA